MSCIVLPENRDGLKEKDSNSCPKLADSGAVPRATRRSRDRQIARAVRKYLKSTEFKNEYGPDMSRMLRQNIAGIQPAFFIHLPRPSRKVTHWIVSFLN